MADWRTSDWLTAGEIAELRLAGMPATKRGVQKHAARHGWRTSARARRRAGQGGGWEYHVSLLPDAALDDLLSRRLAEAGLGQAAGEQVIERGVRQQGDMIFPATTLPGPAAGAGGGAPAVARGVLLHAALRGRHAGEA